MLYLYLRMWCVLVLVPCVHYVRILQHTLISSLLHLIYYYCTHRDN